MAPFVEVTRIVGASAGALAGLLLVACTSGSSTSAPQASGDGSADVSHVECDMKSVGDSVRIEFDLPSGFRGIDKDARRCNWTRRMMVNEGDTPNGVEVLVSVRTVPAGASLRGVYRRQLPFAVEGDVPFGDDSVLELSLTEDVKAIGSKTGDRLSWRCYCDGQDTITRMAQSGNVRLEWTSVHTLSGATDAAFDATLESVVLMHEN